MQKDRDWAKTYREATMNGDTMAMKIHVSEDKLKGLKWKSEPTAQSYHPAIDYCKEKGYSIY